MTAFPLIVDTAGLVAGTGGFVAFTQCAASRHL